MTESATEERLDPAFIKWFAMHARMQREQCIHDCLRAVGRSARAAFLASRSAAFRLIFGAAGSARDHTGRRTQRRVVR
jgi:hypothetical protein